MNTLRITLFVSLAIQVCLSAGILANAEEGPIALITIPIVLLTLVAIDLGGWVKPYGSLLTVAAMGGLYAALREFQIGGESRILAGAHLMVYIMWTFLLQAKDLRRMWWMFALSVLQVALAAVLTSQPWFGAALLLYTVATIWSMSLLSLARAALLANPAALSRAVSQSVAPTAKVWRGAVSRNGFRADERGRWISPRFLGGTGLTFLLSLVVGMMFFVLTPRVWLGSLNGSNERSKRGGAQTGYTESIKLGDMGQLSESDELVLEIDGSDLQSQQPASLERIVQVLGVDPYFRGSTLNLYSRDGQWHFHPSRAWEQHRFPLRWTRNNMVQLNMRVHPTGSPTLFVHELGEVERQESVAFNPERKTWERVDSDLGLPFDYKMLILDRSQDWSGIWRAAQHARDQQRGAIHPQLQACLDNTNDRLTALARKVCGVELLGSRVSDPEVAARKLESYLRDSPEFSYTLDLSIDDPSIDPVEDFVFNRKRGHCEYFATALALMLRGVGIPSRLVSGFKGAQYNPETGKIEVRALHAHAWVEGYVNGGWIPFDATPGDRETEIADKAKEAQNSLVEQSRGAWFLGMNYSKNQQEQLVYGPLRQVGEMVRQNFAGLMEGNLPVLSQIRTLIISPRNWFSFQGALMTCVLLWLGRMGILYSRKAWKKYGGWSQTRDTLRRRVATVEFYERLVKILRKAGFVENPAQTPREMAVSVEARFAPRLSVAGLDGGIGRLVDSFYSVRFGGEPLSANDLAHVERTLGELEREPNR